MSDDFGMSNFGMRRLTAFYSRNFAAHFPATCFQSSYFSPFRMYFKGYNFETDRTTFIYQLDVSSCPFPKADCCRLPLDHMLVRTKSDASVLEVRLDGKVLGHDVDERGLTIYDLAVSPTQLKSMQLEIVTPATGYNYPSDLCPQSRYPGSCDVISYDESKTCCAERAALPYELFFPNNLPPGSVGPDVKAPPPSPLPPAPPSPPPPSPPPPPPSPPPPPPDGWSFCCIDDLPKSPYNLKFMGSRTTGSDTAYSFQLVVRKLNYSYPDFDGPEKGNCAQMNLRDMGVAIYDNLLVKSVQFNGSVVPNYWTEPQGVRPDANWLYIPVMKDFADFQEETPIDFVVTVRGLIPSLCPANEFLHSPNACEFAMHGKDEDTHCCPHGATKKGGPYDDCCVDDIEKAPYRMEYYKNTPTEASTTYDFAIKVVNVTGIDYDLEEEALCDHMTLDYAQIQIYKNVEVVQVQWEDRIMAFNTTPATDYSKWLNINGINRFINDFDPNRPTKFKVTVKGYVNELCPAGWLLDAGGKVICEYALHGTQSDHSCCPHDITRPGQEEPDCGCRDDLAGTPYRLGYQLAGVAPNRTMFNFDMAKVDPAAAADFDGAPDKNFGLDVDCGGMSVKSISFAIHKNINVKDVIFNGFNYTWQYEPYTDTTKWLRILDLDYNPADFPASAPIPLQVLTTGPAVTELCPAASQYNSQAACEYFIFGRSNDSECCPVGVTSWYTPNLLMTARR
ncbi:hypothetical protein HXX76_004757 [Chlamydomonas incerta]|uniref:Pherophorin domain-containing protein n=1 Tax=Chlamydomonas incerta TaxID=51695 RepID=A0A835TKJ3_CHLIN|nr:hypothetical protein HXX76_004757 [Chlamydomonas incerta]|eukprot:KAG2439400.1 hypothetical protein HXX76_004757 [Chlamydomonas incerta]